MTKTLALAAAAGLLVSAAPMTAQAFPIASAPAVASDAGVTLVAEGCGPGFHRGPLLGCRPNRFIARPMVRPLVGRPLCRTVLLPLPHRVCR